MEVLGTAILIKPDKLPERTEAGHLIIPENSVEMLPQIGVVLQAGKACSRIKAGDHVIFPRRASSVIVIDGEDHFLTNEHKVFYNE
ncbi:MAG: co-chaperone GroES [Prolixibacteraceae bacterium]|nr:co-chaperone GroES [Prolixibacteraceae bacterium]